MRRWLAALLLFIPLTTGTAHAGAWTVHASVTPATMAYGTPATLTITTAKGATCAAVVRYVNGRKPVSARKWSGVWLSVPNGTERLTWLEETQSAGGRALVTCRYHGQTKSASASFRVVNA